MDRSSATWFDSHCHIPEGEEGAQWVANARDAGVRNMMNVGLTVEHSRAAAEVAQAFDGVFSSAGVHPHEASGGTDGLAEVLELGTVRAVGEAGLDYFYEHSDRDAQRDAFKMQIQLAHERDLPLIVHTRDAWDDTFEILDALGVPRRTVFHCFTGGRVEAQEGLDRDIVISISGIVTFKNADELRDAVEMIPLEQMMVETDAPYLSPVPMRGKPNEPERVRFVGAEVARIKNLDVDDVAMATTTNAENFYGLR